MLIFFPQDYWSEANGRPVLDARQDWRLMDAWENGSHTIIRVRREIVPDQREDINVYVRTTGEVWGDGDLIEDK